MPNAIINRESNGFPYLDDDNFVAIWPAYTRALAAYVNLISEPAAGQAIAATYGVRRFATVAARDTYFASTGGATAGTICVITGADWRVCCYTSAGWRWIAGAAFSAVRAAIGGPATPPVGPGALTDIAGLAVTVQNPDATAVWEVEANLDVELISNASPVLDVVCSAATTGDELVVAGPANLSGLRLPASRTWRVSGLAAGAQTIKLRAQQLGSAGWRINAGHSHLIVRQVG